MADKTNKNRKTRELKKKDYSSLWHPFTQMSEWYSNDQLIIERGKGNYLYDTEGRRYLDGISSLWVNVHGHRKREIDRAINAQLKKIAHSTLLGLASPPSIELAEQLVKITPKALTKVFFSDSGSTAVEIALKIAFQYFKETEPGSKKDRFIAFTGAYHGDTLGAMGVGEIGPFVGKYSPVIRKALRAPYPYCYRCPVKGAKDFPDCKLACLDVFEKIIKKDHKKIAACIIEPMVQGAAGMITAPKGFLKGVRRITKKYNILLIADEVATGFGRTGKMFACEHDRVTPDLMCLAKGITGGYLPLAATLATEKIFKAFLGPYEDMRAFFHGHTYTGNALASAAAIANLDIFKKEKTIERLQPKIKTLSKELKKLAGLDNVGDIRQRGLMVGIELVANKKTKKRFPATQRLGHKVCMEVRVKGIIIRPLGDTIVLMPPLSITEAELKKLTKIVFESIKRFT
ncbi:MAG: adenosylmethionine--8-amino-7-oxononanoate transaminase [Thermodesulfobacteriota bacterium]